MSKQEKDPGTKSGALEVKFTPSGITVGGHPASSPVPRDTKNVRDKAVEVMA
jgi:hypothetical protein